MEIREWEAYKIKIKNSLVIIIIALCISAGIFYNQCENQKMPASIFPLQREVLEQVLSGSGLGWNAAEENTLREDHVLYVINNQEGQPVAEISSVGGNEKRILQINFLALKGTQANISQKDWEKAVRLATILYGGFKNENQVYKNFQETYDERVIIDRVPGYNPEFCERIRWENEIGGVNCFLGFGGQEKGGGLSKAQLVTIIFSQKPETGM